MKKIKLVSTLFFSLSCLGAYAGIENCGTMGTNYVHCAYSTDSGNAPSSKFSAPGNYLQISVDGQSAVACIPYGAGMSIDSTEIQQEHIPMGKHLWKFNVCSDQTCQKSIPILTDAFTLSQTANGYNGDPQNRSFTFAGYFPSVSCTFAMSKIHLK